MALGQQNGSAASAQVVPWKAYSVQQYPAGSVPRHWQPSGHLT
jgi:hypothetical protein